MSNVIVYSVYRCFDAWTMPSWDTFQTLWTAMARFLRGHGLNLQHLQYECLEPLSIWEPPVYNLVYRSSEMYIMASWGIPETPRPLRHDDWWSFSKRPWPKLSPAIWMLKAAKYLSNVIVYSGISLFWYLNNPNNGKLGYLWDPLDCCSTMADGRFLKGNGLKLYHPKHECLGLLSILEPPLYTLVYRRCEMCIMPSCGIFETC